MTASATIQATIAGHYINGQWLTASPDGLGDSLNPATGQVLGRYVLGNASLAQQAVAAPQIPLVNAQVMASPEVDVISFTGSRATGKKIMAAAANTLKRVSLELGGKSPAVIFPDADFDKVVQQLVPASLSISGQMCVSVSRLLVHEDCYQELKARFAKAYEAYRVGPAADRNSQMGPMIDQAGQQRILQWIDRAAAEGEIIVRGKTLTGEHSRGFFITPTLFRIDDVQSELVQEELFGPMVSLETFASEAEALARANATRYGLAAAVYTRDLNTAQRVSRGLKFGTVWINSYMKLFPEIETGGYRESGLGRLHGVEALNDFLETKHIYIDASG